MKETYLLNFSDLDPSIVRFLMHNDIVTIADLNKENFQKLEKMGQFQYKLFKSWLKKNNLQL